MPAVASAGEAPVSRRPQRSDIGREHPRSGHPVIAGRRPEPIPRRPDVVIPRAIGLFILRHRRWRLGSVDFLLVGGVVGVAGSIPTGLVIAGLVVASLVRRRWWRLILAVLLRCGRLRRVRLVRGSLRLRRIGRAIIICRRGCVGRRVVRVGRIALIVLVR